MRASKYFATRMATSERVQHRLQEISRELSLQKVTSDDDDDNSLVSQETENQPNKQQRPSSGSVVSSQTAQSSFSKRSNNSVQVVNMTILGARHDDDDQGPTRVDSPRKSSPGSRRDRSKADTAAPLPETSPTMSSLLRPRLASTTSLRSLSSSHQSSTSSSSNTNKSLAAKHIFRRPSASPLAAAAPSKDRTTWSRRLERGFYLLPTALSMTIMILATVTALVRTLFFDAWTPLLFFGLMALYISGGLVIHYNQVFWRKRLLRDDTANSSMDGSFSKLPRPQLLRRQSSRRGGRRPMVQRQASSASMTSVAGNSILSTTANKAKKKSSWKFWKWQSKKTKLKSI